MDYKEKYISTFQGNEQKNIIFAVFVPEEAHMFKGGFPVTQNNN